jgi:cytochrome c-type protein NapB
MMFNRKTLIAAAILTILIATGCAMSSDISDESLGFRKAPLIGGETTIGDKTSYGTTAAGESKLIARAFENAPPMIPHDVEGLLPITTNNNSCLGCHDPQVAAAVGAVPVSASHMFDMRNDTLLATVSHTRFNCTQCHAPQSDNKMWVENKFQADFRQEDGATRSNLLDILNEGVQ